ncbi:MAG: hypothetical protein ACREPW_02365, partial [Candidatus Binataceae bacterium]
MPRKRPPQPPGAASPASAISDGGLLASAFSGPSWGRWRAILRAAYAEPLSVDDEALFREVAGGRDPPSRPVRELWCIVGRGGGKDSIASAIATVAALGDHRGQLRPGEKATVACIAANRDQAEIVKGYVVGYFTDFPLLAPLVERQTDDGLLLRNGCEIVAFPNSFRSIRGRTIVCAVFDEAAFWRDARSVAPDTETYHAILPSLERVPGSMLVGISTPYRRAGLLFDKFSESYGKDDPEVLVVRGTSRQFNENIRQRTIDDAMARDPDRAASEWLAEWRSDLSDFIDRELVESAVDAGVVVRPPVAGTEYAAFADPSGGRGDGFACAIAHAEGDVAVLDALYERAGAFDPSAVVREIAELLRSYGVSRLTGDKYAAGWPPEAFAKVGVAYQASDRDRSALYIDALPLFTSGRVRLLDNKQLVYQFASLERRTSRFGRDAVNHPADGHDDIANAAAGALVAVAGEAKPTLIRRSQLLTDTGAGVPIPRRCQCINVVVWVDGDGIAASTIWSYWDHGTPPLVL